MKGQGSVNKWFSGFGWVQWLQVLCLAGFTATLTLDARFNSTLLFASLFCCLLSFRFTELKNHRRPLLFFTGLFLVAMLSLVWSMNRPEGWRVIERQLALFFIPVMFFSSIRNKYKVASILLVVFYLSVLGVCCYLLKFSIHNFLAEGVSLKEWTVKENLYHAFASPIHMHATYLSLYVALAILLGFHWFLSGIRWWNKILIFLSVLVLAVTLTLLSSRVVISSLVFILFFVYPFFIGQLRNKPVLIVAGIITLLTFFFIIRESSFIYERFYEHIGDEVRMTRFLQPDSTYNPVYGGETRADRWYCAVELVRESPLIGYGTGSEKDVLILKFNKYNLQNAVVNRYDAHNQYLAYGIKSGALGVLVFLLAIGFGVYYSLKRKHFLYFAFVLLFTISCITENVLESNKGIFFYAYFNALLYFLAQGLPPYIPDLDNRSSQSPVGK